MRHDEILGLLPRLNFGAEDHFGLWLLLLELLFWAAVVALTIALVRFRPALVERTEQALKRISQHQRTCLLAFGLAVVVIRVGLLPLVPVPIPFVHDEFSYLLGGDTFAHGRVTNPAHPMWQHFESFHINVRPTYQSMYPPAQAITLAIGQKLTGVPWMGVVLSTALMCSVIYWMLLGWLPGPWAWLGGAFAVLRFGIFSYWINSYWGGTVAAIGGALVIGALPRLRKNLSVQMLLLLAAGLLILENSRPLEGFVFSLPIVIAVLFLLRKGPWPTVAKRLLPALALLVLGAGWQLYFDWRSTGHPLLMPYTVNYRTYHISKPFMFLKPNPIPQYIHPSMRAFYVYHEYVDVSRLQLWEKDALIYIFQVKGAVFYVFYLWPFLLLVAPALVAMGRDKDFRIVLIATAMLGICLGLEMWPSTPHYAAPWTGAIVLLVLYSLRHYRNSHPGHGEWGARATAIVLAVWMLSPISERLIDPLFEFPPAPPVSKEAAAVIRRSFWVPLEISRQRIEAELDRIPGNHLVVVHHPYHDVPGMDWIYNRADIDNAKIVWARDMGYLKNQELVAYYPDRQVWYVDRGDPIARTLPYDKAILPWKIALEKFEPGENGATDAQAPASATNVASKMTQIVGISTRGGSSQQTSANVKELH